MLILVSLRAVIFFFNLLFQLMDSSGCVPGKALYTLYTLL